MPKVLICDNELYVGEAVAFVVRREGYEVISAENGEGCLLLAREHRPALVLLDVMMPGKTGFEVCSDLKSDPATQGIYVILLTAKCQERDISEGLRRGADDYMTKPFRPSELSAKLHRLLDGLP